MKLFEKKKFKLILLTTLKITSKKIKKSTCNEKQKLQKFNWIVFPSQNIVGKQHNVTC
jgi:hypothetical protein